MDIKAKAMAVSPSRFVKSLDPVERAFGEGTLHGAVWVLATDERVAARRALERLMTKLGRMAEKTVKEIERFEKEFQETWDEDDVPPIAEIDHQRSRRPDASRKRNGKPPGATKSSRPCEKSTKIKLDKLLHWKKSGLGFARRRPGLRGRSKLSLESWRSYRRPGRPSSEPSKETRKQKKKWRGFVTNWIKLDVPWNGIGSKKPGWRRPRASPRSWLAVTRKLSREQNRTALRTKRLPEISERRSDGCAPGWPKSGERRPPQERPRLYREQWVGVFLDVSNLYLSALEYYRRQLDYERLTETALNGRVLATALAYNVDSAWGDKSAFYEMLRGIGYEIRTKDLVVRSDGSMKGDWDVGIAADIIERLDRLDVVVLGSGDGDFLPVVLKAQARGVAVEVYAFPNTAVALKEEADYYLIDESLLMEEVSRFARPEGAMGKNELLQAISEALGAPAGFLGKLSVAKLEKLLHSLKSLSG